MKIRLCGLVLFLFGTACFALMVRLAGLPAGTGMTALRLALAAVTVVAGLAGLAPLCCGKGLFAQVPVPLRSRHSITGVVEAI